MFTLTCEQALHVRVSQSKRRTVNFHLSENIVRQIEVRERWFFTEWNFIVLDADWLLLIRNDYYPHPYQWINLYTHIIIFFLECSERRCSFYQHWRNQIWISKKICKLFFETREIILRWLALIDVANFAKPSWRNGLARWTSNSKVVGSSPIEGDSFVSAFLYFYHFFFSVLKDGVFFINIEEFRY